jgi:phage/plasmid-like protein (TIGR03299 family)
VPALFEKGFCVREASWHGEETLLDEYPGREEAMIYAGHDFEVIKRPIQVVGNHVALPADDWKALVKSGTTEILTVVRSTYEVIQNSVAYDIAEALFDAGFEYETGITLDGGRVCALTLKLNEPIMLRGDNSKILPFGCLSWAHDGSGSLRARSGLIRQVCMNTTTASEAEGRANGTAFTFRHTKNVHNRIEEAKKVVHGLREDVDVYVKAMEELGSIEVTPHQRDMFVSTIIGDRGGIVSRSAAASDRVKNNLEAERAKINALFFGPTIPEDHTLTGYGLHLAGVEYFDHLRAYRSKDSYVKRTLLADNPAKASLTRTIRDLVAA